MNRIIKLLQLFLLVTLIVFNSCQKDHESYEDETNITSEVQKIETIYEEGAIKIENDNSCLKNEMDAPESLKENILNELGQSYSKRRTY